MAFIAGLGLVIIIIFNVNKNQEQQNAGTQDVNERTYLLSSEGVGPIIVYLYLLITMKERKKVKLLLQIKVVHLQTLR